MGVFQKQGVWWIDYYVNGSRKRERIGSNKRLAETVLQKRKVEIVERWAEGHVGLAGAAGKAWDGCSGSCFGERTGGADGQGTTARQP